MRGSLYLLYQKMRKICSCCKIEKWGERFPKKGNQCLSCQKEKREKIKETKRKYDQQYRAENKENFHNNGKPMIKRIKQKLESVQKIGSLVECLPYSMQELKEYIEQQFEPWMNWNNQGKYNSKTWDDNDQSTWVWQIDHIIPQSDLPYNSMKDDNFKKCWALSNLRPLSAKQNLIDGVTKVRHNLGGQR